MSEKESELAKGITPVPAEQQAMLRVPISIGDQGLVPRTLDDMWRISLIFAKSGLVPLKKPEEIFVAMQVGLEVGLGMMQACQSICVINGRPSLYGDAALALVRASGLCESFKEEPIYAEFKDGGPPDREVIGYRATGKRKGEPEPIIRTFTKADAIRAKLWGKAGPWMEYPQRMYQFRARSWTLRDGWADVLRGLVIAEEAQDIKVPGPVAPASVIEEATSGLRDRLTALAEKAADHAQEIPSEPAGPAGQILLAEDDPDAKAAAEKAKPPNDSEQLKLT